MAIDYAAMTPLQRQVLAARQAKPAKYGAHRTEYNGEFYDSKAEAEYAKWLDVFGGIEWRLRQVPVQLGPDFKTRVDFLVATIETVISFGGLRSDRDLIVRAHEVKGAETKDFKRVKRLWPKYGPFQLVIIKRGKQPETIEGKR